MKFSGSSRRLWTAAIPCMTLLLLSVDTAFGSGGGVEVIPDKTIIFQIINFIVLIFLLNIILYKPIRSVLIQRQEKINGLEESIESCTTDVVEKEDAFAAGIREARAKGVKEKEALLADAAEEEKKIIQEINEKAQANLSEIRKKNEKDAEGVRVSLSKEVSGFADAIGQKILGRAI